MKMKEAMDIIEDRQKPAGFMVTFEIVVGRMLYSDHFPDVRAGEAPIPTEDEAWELAGRFAAKTRNRCVNVYVIQREEFKPVPGYRDRMIENR